MRVRSRSAVDQRVFGDYWCRLAVVMLAGAMVVVITRPALADEVGGDYTPTELVEQALAILVNAPGSMEESLERIEAVLAEDPSELNGLDTEALERAATAIEADDDHAAENALLEALGLAPLPDVEEGESGVLTSPALVRGPTERIEAGFQSPGLLPVVAALILVGVGIYLVRRREGHA